MRHCPGKILHLYILLAFVHIISYNYILSVTIPPENEGDEREEEEDAIPGQRNYTVQHLYNSNSTKCLYIFQI